MPTSLSESDALLVLNALPGIGPISLNRLLAKFNGDPRAVLKAGAAELGWERPFDVARERARMAEAGAVFIAAQHPDYPRLLREIPDPPLGLYRQGQNVLDRVGIAIVGSRRATPYGLGIAKKLGSELAQSGFCVVSGLALGVDAAAHEGALAAGGATAAVLGAGLDIVYPPENRHLYPRIAESGAILSEFPFGRGPTRQSFAMRNRIVAGICTAVVVVESAVDGGAMITARLAGEQGRTVFAVPGRIDQITSAGCHQLIRDGAALLTGLDDLLQELNYLDGLQPTPIPAPVNAPSIPLTEDETLVMACFRGGETPTLDQLAAQTNFAAGRLSAVLLALELKRQVAKRIDASYEALAP